jgi:hypothetical protein
LRRRRGGVVLVSAARRVARRDLVLAQQHGGGAAPRSRIVRVHRGSWLRNQMWQRHRVRVLCCER